MASRWDQEFYRHKEQQETLRRGVKIRYPAQSREDPAPRELDGRLRWDKDNSEKEE